MGILVVGSVALDDVQTPVGHRPRTLGGACTYFATAASLYTRVSVVGVVGTDFPQEHIDFLRTRDIDLRGLQVMDGKTFFWAGRYGTDLDNAETLDTQLNVFADFHPTVPQDLRGSEYVFLANIDPELQIEVLKQVSSPRLTALDSMNFWITSKRDTLTEALSMVDVVFLNEAEVKLYAQDGNLIAAAGQILDLGPRALIIKRGEHGAMLVTRGDGFGQRFFLTPAYPLERVVDPTGAGDTFAAGFMGYLASSSDLSLETFRRAVVHGTVVASFTVEDFSIDRLRSLQVGDIRERYDMFRSLTHFDPLADEECRAFRNCQVI
ncbi:MAG TPA: sugar kinase [Chloroflexi bacterium]|nr:sugar kinase [Chloroflexota bacterium]